MNEEPHVSGEQSMGAAVPQEANQSNQASEQDRQVPLAALESERSKRQQLEDENRMYREHLALMQAQRPSIPQPPQQDEFEGLQDSDVMTVGDFKKHTQKIAGQFQMTLEELKMTQRYPDYQEVVSKYLPELFKTNPGLRGSLQKTQDYELAYYLAKNSDAYKGESKRQTRHQDAERIIKNTQQAGSLSSMGGATPVAQAKRYKDMTDHEFNELMHKNLGY